MAKNSYHCAVEATVDVAGGKWKPVIIFHLLSGKKRFGELKKTVGDVSQRSLTMQLRQLEVDGVVERVQLVPGPVQQFTHRSLDVHQLFPGQQPVEPQRTGVRQVLHQSQVAVVEPQDEDVARLICHLNWLPGTWCGHAPHGAEQQDAES